MDQQVKSKIWADWTARAKRDNLVSTSLGCMPLAELELLKSKNAVRVLKQEEVENKFLGKYTFYECMIRRDYPILVVTNQKGEERFFDEGGIMDALRQRMDDLKKTFKGERMEIQYFPRAYTKYLEEKSEMNKKQWGADQYNKKANETLKMVVEVFKDNIDLNKIQFT